MDDNSRSTQRPGRTLDEAWHDERLGLQALASRMLRDPIEADDVVQEAFGRLMGVDLAEIDDVGAWLAVVVRRICLNRISSAYRRRESTAGAAPLDGVASDARTSTPATNPADRVTLDDQVKHALAVVLDELSPPERTSFVLHDIFGFPYAEIGALVGRTEAACRQLASRARRTIRSTPASVTEPGPSIAGDQHRRLVERFVEACSAGDVAGLIEVLDPDVAGETVTSDGLRLGSGDGRDEVVRGAMRFVGPDSGTVLVPIVGEGGVDVLALYPDGRYGVFDLDTADGVITTLHITVVSPDDATAPSE